ncbi:MAG TPA: ATP-dependent DNA helicase RecG [Gaiellaceae bacterium]|nr:ATP-dependent DNA helicase RecG [Gaiellaceae bacterium]
MTRLPTGFAVLDRPAQWTRPRASCRSEAFARPLDTLRGVGPTVARRLGKLGLRTVGDLLAHAPRRYEAAAPERRIADLLAEEEVAIAGVVRDVSVRRPRRRLAIVRARVEDESGDVPAIWFNQEWLATKLQPGTQIRLRGRLQRGEFQVRAYDLGDALATADFAPVYPAGEEVTPQRLRALVDQVLPLAHGVPDPLPAELGPRLELPIKGDALHALHRPASLDEAAAARRRLALEELLVLQVGLARRRRERERGVARALPPPSDLVDRFREALPFRLTEGQEQAIRELDADLERQVPMERLLQGDVGSGKTVVAVYALLRAVESGFRGALMAPTETLAEQHFLTVESLCAPLGVTCGLLTSSVGKRERAQAATASVVVGTHALIQAGVDLGELAVAVVDEQHRFGVEQRKALTAMTRPHTLHMTATPIPRTLALTVYGDLAVSEIAQLPEGRQPVVTSWVTAERSSEAYRRLRRHLEAGRQAYVVCPLVSESVAVEARAAEQEAERLRQAELHGLRVGCMHGQLRPAERRELMAQFKDGRLDVLVATTVIEVGVDVPNATIMIVQEADRFGLAQLHQLRGRVGRGAEQSYCLLVSRPKEELTESAVARLEALVETADGFRLAEVDLDLRGAGELLGTRQSGLTDFRFARLVEDRPLLELARVEAAELAGYEGPLDEEVERRFEAEPATA